MKSILFILSFLIFIIQCSPVKENQNVITRVVPGIDVLFQENLPLIDGKRIGLITNPTGVNRKMQSTIDIIERYPNANLTTLFGPEHGVRGDRSAGQTVEDMIDDQTGCRVYSLYGRNRRPSQNMLDSVDVLVYDIQDIGSRAYTYITTLAYCMQAAAEKNIPFIVLDRPNPLGGELIEGPMLEEAYRSFIGVYPIPYIYGMTVGELALYFNTEFNIACNCQVIQMKNWDRAMTFSDTGLQWVPTSPHVPHPETPFFLAALGCLGELHLVNEGVGYTQPFELVGSNFIKASNFTNHMNSLELEGVVFRPVHYQPFYTDWKSGSLQGAQLHITDYSTFKPMKVQLAIMLALKDLYPNDFYFATHRLAMFDKAMGTNRIRTLITEGFNLDVIYSETQSFLGDYLETRRKYLLY